MIFRNLIADEPHIGNRTDFRYDRAGYFVVVETQIAIAQKSPYLAFHHTKHTLFRIFAKPEVDVLCEQRRTFGKHPIIILDRDA